MDTQDEIYLDHKEKCNAVMPLPEIKIVQFNKNICVASIPWVKVNIWIPLNIVLLAQVVHVCANKQDRHWVRTLQWRHNGRHSISNHHFLLFACMFPPRIRVGTNRADSRFAPRQWETVLLYNHDIWSFKIPVNSFRPQCSVLSQEIILFAQNSLKMNIYIKHE